MYRILNFFRNKRLPFWEFAVMAVFVCCFLLPNHFGVSIVPFVGLAVLYCFWICRQDRKLKYTIHLFLALSFLIAFLYLFLTDTQSISTSSNLEIKRIVSKFQQYVWMFFPLLLGHELIRRGNSEQKFIMGLLMAGLIVWVVYQTLIAIAINPNAARSFHLGEEMGEEASMFVGNYYFIYLIPFLIALAFAVIIKDRRILTVVICTALILFLFEFLLEAQFTLSILISFLGILLMLGFKMKGGIGKIAYAVIVFIFLLLLPTFLSFGIEHIHSDQIVVRLKEVYSYLVDGNVGGYNLSGRLNLYKKTINAFAYSPIWGNRRLPFDGHATLLTIPADVGLLGAIPFYFLLFRSRRLAAGYVSDKGVMNVVFIMLLMMGLTNPIHGSSQISFGVWFITPFVLDYFKEKNTVLNEPE